MRSEPFSKEGARELEARSLGMVKPYPLIQNFLAREMVGKAVRRQSAGEEMMESCNHADNVSLGSQLW
jgi:hypothetical protein